MIGQTTRALCATLALAATHASAADLSFVRSFEMPGPSGLAYDERLCALWVANETREVVLVNLWGDEVLRFTSDLTRVDAVAMVGDHLLLSDGNANFQKVGRDGVAVAKPFRMPVGYGDTDGLYFDEATGEYWITDDSIRAVFRVDAGGTVRQTLGGATMTPPMLEPQGVTRDPVSGHLLVVDDADASDSLFEFDAQGRLLDVLPLARDGMRDAEGISIQPDTSTLFVAYDEGDTVAVFQYYPTATPLPAKNPEPGNCLISGFPSPYPPV